MGYQYQDLQHHHHHHHHRLSHLHCHHAQCSWCPFALLSVCSARSSGHRDPSALAHFTGYKEAKKNRNNIFCWVKMVPFCNGHRRYQSLHGIRQTGVLGLTFVSKAKYPIMKYLSNIYTPNATQSQRLRWNWAKRYLLRKRLVGRTGGWQTWWI